MIISSLIFNFEIDMLELHLIHHDPYVDKFIIVESNTNFHQDPKDYNLQKNWDRFAKYHHKIELINIDSAGLSPGWVTENYQRSISNTSIKKTIRSDEDIILFIDTDEFIYEAAWPTIRSSNQSICQLHLFYCYYNNFYTKFPFNGPTTIRAKNFFDACSHRRDNRGQMIENAGLHLSWFGDDDETIAKAKSSVELKRLSKIYENASDLINAKQKGKLFSFSKKFRKDRFKIIKDESLPNFYPQHMIDYIKKVPKWRKD